MAETIGHAAILAGGQARRFGADKLRHVLAGESLLGRCLKTVRAAGLQPLVVGRTPGLGDGWQGIADSVPGQGPVGGLVTALRHLNAPLLLLAGDLPLLTSEHLCWLLAQKRGVDGLVPMIGDQPQVTSALYAPGLLPRLEAALAAGQRSLRRVVAACAFASVEIPTAWQPAWLNCNTPADVTQAARLLQPERKRKP